MIRIRFRGTLYYSYFGPYAAPRCLLGSCATVDLLRGSGDLVSRAITTVTLTICTYTSKQGTYNLA